MQVIASKLENHKVFLDVFGEYETVDILCISLRKTITAMQKNAAAQITPKLDLSVAFTTLTADAVLILARMSKSRYSCLAAWH